MPGQALRWVRAHDDLTRFSVTEVVVINGANQLTLVLLAPIGGLAVVGALRGAQVLTAPATILALSAMAFAVPELARRPSLAGTRLVRAGLAISGACVALMSVWGALLLLLPDGVGRAVLGETWGPTSAILVPSVIAMLVGVASLGPSAGVYARGAMRVLFPLVLVGGPVYLVAGVLGVVVGGAFGAATGLAVAAAYLSVISWVRFLPGLAPAGRPGLGLPHRAGADGQRERRVGEQQLLAADVLDGQSVERAGPCQDVAEALDLAGDARPAQLGPQPLDGPPPLVQVGDVRVDATEGRDGEEEHAARGEGAPQVGQRRLRVQVLQDLGEDDRVKPPGRQAVRLVEVGDQGGPGVRRCQVHDRRLHRGGEPAELVVGMRPP